RLSCGVVIQCNKLPAVRLEINPKVKGELILLAGKHFDNTGGTFFKRHGLSARLVQIGKSQTGFNILAEIDFCIEVKVFRLRVELYAECFDVNIKHRRDTGNDPSGEEFI